MTSCHERDLLFKRERQISPSARPKVRPDGDVWIQADRTWFKLGSKHIDRPVKAVKRWFRYSKFGNYWTKFIETYQEYTYINKHEELYGSDLEKKFSFKEMIRLSHLRATCKHEALESESHITGDSGSEDMYCPTCGFQHHICYF